MDSESKTISTARGSVSFGEHGAGAPFAVLHSLLTDRTAFDTVLDDLPGRALTFDLPGFGMTDPEDDIVGFADAMASGIATACAGELPVTVIGNGLGSFVALGVAVRHPEVVRRLILVGCGATFPEPARPAFANMAAMVEEGGMGAVAAVALRRIFTEQYLDEHPEAAAQRTEVLMRTDPEAFVTACRALREVDFTGQAGSIDCPVLIVVGNEDAATPPPMARQLDELLPNSTLVTMPGVAHAPQLQDPDGFVSNVVGFMEGS